VMWDIVFSSITAPKGLTARRETLITSEILKVKGVLSHCL